MGGSEHGTASSALTVYWGALPAPQIMGYHDGVLYIDFVKWQTKTNGQRWAIIDALRGLRSSEGLQLHGRGNRERIECAYTQLTAVSNEIWTLLVETQA